MHFQLVGDTVNVHWLKPKIVLYYIFEGTVLHLSEEKSYAVIDLKELNVKSQIIISSEQLLDDISELRLLSLFARN